MSLQWHLLEIETTELAVLINGCMGTYGIVSIEMGFNALLLKS